VDCINCGHMMATHVASPIPNDGDICLVDDCTCGLYEVKENHG
jgi:hypothetical protein